MLIEEKTRRFVKVDDKVHEVLILSSAIDCVEIVKLSLGQLVRSVPFSVLHSHEVGVLVYASLFRVVVQVLVQIAHLMESDASLVEPGF